MTDDIVKEYFTDSIHGRYRLRLRLDDKYLYLYYSRNGYATTIPIDEIQTYCKLLSELGCEPNDYKDFDTAKWDNKFKGNFEGNFIIVSTADIILKHINMFMASVEYLTDIDKVKNNIDKLDVLSIDDLKTIYNKLCEDSSALQVTI